jgi:hypothetical protein
MEEWNGGTMEYSILFPVIAFKLPLSKLKTTDSEQK